MGVVFQFLGARVAREGIRILGVREKISGVNPELLSIISYECYYH